MQAQSDESLPEGGVGEGEGEGCRWEKQRGSLAVALPRRPLRAAACRPAGLAHSLAAMKLMWGLTRGKRGRLLLNSVMSWTNVGWGGKKKRKRVQIRAAFPLMYDHSAVCSLEDKALPKLHLVPVAKTATRTLFPWKLVKVTYTVGAAKLRC